MSKRVPELVIRKPPAAVDINNFLATLEDKVDGLPSTVHDKPSTISGGPSTTNGRPQTVDDIRSAVHGMSSTENRRPSAADGASSTVHRIPSAVDGAPFVVAVDGAPSTVSGVPSAVDRGPFAVDGLPRTVNGMPWPLTVSRKPKTEDRWDASHKRATFHVPKDVLKALEREVKRTGLSKSRLVTEALSALLLDGVGGRGHEDQT